MERITTGPAPPRWRSVLADVFPGFHLRHLRNLRSRTRLFLKGGWNADFADFFLHDVLELGATLGWLTTTSVFRAPPWQSRFPVPSVSKQLQLKQLQLNQRR